MTGGRPAPWEATVVQVGEDGIGPLFKLDPPHTLASIRADAARAAEDRPLMCRWRHKSRRIGRVYIPEDEGVVVAALAVLAAADVSALCRCERCGAISVRRSY